MQTNNLPKVFVVVLNYNGKASLLECLRSLHNCSYPNLEIIVVDNASNDGSLEIAKNTYGNLIYIKNSKNIGFSSGNNIGIRYALEKFGEYVFLLNNDAEVQKDTILDLVEFAQKDASLGIVSPIILNKKDSGVWFAGGKIDWLKMRATHKNIVPAKPMQIEYASGCAMLIKNIVFKKVGLFDEDYFLYYEDTDFSLKTLRNNFQIFLLPSAKISHWEHSNKNNPRKTYWLVFSALIFFKKNATFPIKIWQFFYKIARKVKNFFDCVFFPNDNSKMTRNAYQDFKKYHN
jgi:GT2 family glycosyltransferase